MELKTLKDLVRGKDVCKGCAWMTKQEAIKWVKLLKKSSNPPMELPMFISFFNISEEDLKGGNEDEN